MGSGSKCRLSVKIIDLCHLLVNLSQRLKMQVNSSHLIIFPPFKQVWSLGFLESSLRHFWLVFLFSFLKWNSILCQIYWIPDLQSLKLVCFIVANVWERKCADSWFFLTRSLQDGDFWSVLNRERQRIKTLQILVLFF